MLIGQSLLLGWFIVIILRIPAKIITWWKKKEEIVTINPPGMPAWATCSNPQRVNELLEIMETRQLTDKEAQDLYEASDGPMPPQLEQDLFAAELEFRIGIAEFEKQNGP